MKIAYINKRRYLKISAIILCAVMICAALCISAGAVMDLPGGMGRSGNGVGMENNIPENGNAGASDTMQGNLGDTDGDGKIEDKGTGDGIMGDMGDMGSDIVSDIGDMGSDIVSDVEDGLGMDRDSTGNNTTDRAPADSGTTDNVKGNGGSIVAIVIAIIIAIALIILIIAIIPRNKNKH